MNGLLLSRNSDGGWGTDVRVESDIKRTTLALQALKSANYADATVINSAITYLTNNQNTDGGYGFSPSTSSGQASGDSSNTYMTAMVLNTLSQFKTIYDLQAPINKASAYLLTNQNTDGGFGSSPSNVYETALSLMALIESGQGQALPLQNAINYLTAAQSANGSWNDDPYSTALALRALANAQTYMKPNLSILNSDIQLSKAMLIVGDTVNITAAVKNTGLEVANNVVVNFYDHDPAQGALPVSSQTITSITVGGSVQISFPYTVQSAGPQYFFVSIDPDNAIAEISETDNLGIAQLKVYDKPDLVVQSITFLPELPYPGQTVNVEIKIANTGGLPAENIQVKVMFDGTEIGNSTIPSLNSLDTHIINLSLQNMWDGSHQMGVTVDPANAIAEKDKTNNTLVVPIAAKERKDLAVGIGGILFSDSIPKEGKTISISAVIRNNRENEARNVAVRFYDGDPASGGTQIGADQVIAVVPGEGSGVTGYVSYDTTGKTGMRAIYVIVDPLSAIEETDETNNSAVSTILVPGRPDLVVQDIQFTPAPVEEGSSVSVKAVVKNNGSVQAAASKLKFYLGDPASGGAQIGIDQSVAALNPGETATIGPVSQSTTGMLGDRAVYARADVFGSVDEINETNNFFAKTFTVVASTKPDLAITASDLSYTPDAPGPGDTIAISIMVRNLRNSPAENVQLNIYDGNPASDGLLIGTMAISRIAGMGTETAEFRWTAPEPAGMHTIYVKIDPDNAIAEYSETNNTAFISIITGLPAGAAPVNLTATPLNSTDISLAWDLGPDAAAYGITGYKVYRVGKQINGLKDISKEGTSSASSAYSSDYSAGKATDGDVNTAWYAAWNAPMPQWWQKEFTTQRNIKKIAIYWYASLSAKDFQIQTWNGTQWVTQSTVTGNGYEITVHEFPTALAASKVRVYVTAANNVYFPSSIREIDIYEDRTATSNVYQDKGLGAGEYTYFVKAVDSAGRESSPSNSASASVGDSTPPAPPAGVSATVSGFAVNLSWNANRESDLAGYRVYKKGLNVAHQGRGATAVGNYTYYTANEPLTDGDPTSVGVSYWNSSSNSMSPMTVVFAKAYDISKVRIYLSDLNSDKRFYRYMVESSLDGKVWQRIVDKTTGGYIGWQEDVFAQPVKAKYIRVTGTYCSVDNSFRVGEIEVYSSELAPVNLGSATAMTLSLSNYASFTEYTYELNTSSRKPRKFRFSEFNTEEKDILFVYDKDTGALLASYSGNIGGFVTQPLTAANYRFRFIADYEGTATGFKATHYIEQGKQAGTTYSDTIYQNGSYVYAVSAVDVSGNESAFSTVSTPTISDTTAPSVPVNLAATAGNKTVSLKWNANSEVDLAGYNLYRNNETTPVNGSKPITATSFQDKTVVNLTAYTYRITAVDVNGNESAKSAAVSAVPTGFDLVLTSSDIWFKPLTPSVIDDVTVSALVHNTGTDIIQTPFTVKLYLGNPASGGVLIGTETLPSINGGGATLVNFHWNPAGHAGTNTFYAFVDKEGAIRELSESNNTASFQITVKSAPSINVSLTSVDATKFPEIDTYVKVVDSFGDGIFNLTAEQFSAQENGTSETPITVTPLNVPGYKPIYDIVFVVDDTGSMGTILDKVKSNIAGFIDRLSIGNVDYALGLVTFKDDKTVYNNGYLTGNKDSYIAWINALTSSGGGDYREDSLDALEAATTMKLRAGARRIFVLIGDAGPHTLGDGSGYSSNTVASIIKKLNDAAATVYIIGPTEHTEWVDVCWVCSSYSVTTSMDGVYFGAGSISQETGGAFYKNSDDFIAVGADLAARISRVSGDYKITYTTHDSVKNGTVRNVTVAASYANIPGMGAGQYKAPLSSKPDLAVKSLSLSNDYPLAGESVTVTAEVWNTGGVNAQNVLVRFYDGDPEYGIQIGDDQVVPVLAASGNLSLEAAWHAVPGTHDIYVTLDPLGAVDESDENNNRAFKRVTTPGLAMPELGLSGYDIVLSANPPLKGQKVTATTTIHNSGISANDVLVQTYIGDPRNGGLQIGSVTIPSLEANSEQPVSFEWTVDQAAGTYDIYTWIDPYNAIPEENKENNIAHKTVTIAEKKLTLVVATDKVSYPAATDAGISLDIRNTGNAVWFGTASALIEDTTGNRVAQVATSTINSLPPAGQKTMSLVWNTGATLAGVYRVRAVLSESGSAVTESSTSFAILPDMRASAVVTTDKATYHANEMVAVNTIITNSSSNYIFENLNAKISISGQGLGSGVRIFEETKAIQILTPDQLIEFKTYWNTGNNTPGVYTAILTLRSSTGDILTTFQMTFEILPTSQTGEGLKGTVAASPSSVYQGKEPLLTYIITNLGNVDLSNVNLKVLIADPDTHEAKAEVNDIRSVTRGETVTKTQTVSTANLAPKKYLAILQAEVGGNTKTLASATFEVLPTIEIKQTSPDYGRVLVWINDGCGGTVPTTPAPPYQGGEQEKCIRKDLIEKALKETGVTYNILTDKKDFQAELRNNYYTDFIILGNFNPLQDHYGEELREKIFSGKGLITSPWIGESEGEMLGIKVQGKLSQKDSIIEISEGDIFRSQLYQSFGEAVKIDASPDNVLGWITANKGPSKYPAVVKKEYGNGKAIYFSFDLGLSVKEENYAQFVEVLRSAVNYTHTPENTPAYHPYDLVPVRLELKSLGAEFDMKALVRYPGEIKIFDPLTSAWVIENSWEKEVHLDASETKNINLLALTPDAVGTYALTTDISYLEDGTYKPYQTLLTDMKVEKDANTLTNDILYKLSTLYPTLSGEMDKLNEAKAYLESVRNHPIIGSADTITSAIKYLN